MGIFDTDAIALASPSGRMSKRALKDAQKRISMKLFGPGGIPGPQPLPYNKKESLLRQAKQLRELATPQIGRDGRIITGMHPRAYLKKAKQLEAEAYRE